MITSSKHHGGRTNTTGTGSTNITSSSAKHSAAKSSTAKAIERGVIRAVEAAGSPSGGRLGPRCAPAACTD